MFYARDPQWSGPKGLQGYSGMALTLSRECPEVCPECVLTAWMVGQTWALVLADSGSLQTAVAGPEYSLAQLPALWQRGVCGEVGHRPLQKAVPPEGTPPHAGN